MAIVTDADLRAINEVHNLGENITFAVLSADNSAKLGVDGATSLTSLQGTFFGESGGLVADQLGVYPEVSHKLWTNDAAAFSTAGGYKQRNIDRDDKVQIGTIKYVVRDCKDPGQLHYQLELQLIQPPDERVKV